MASTVPYDDWIKDLPLGKAFQNYLIHTIRHRFLRRFRPFLTTRSKSNMRRAMLGYSKDMINGMFYLRNHVFVIVYYKKKPSWHIKPDAKSDTVLYALYVVFAHMLWYNQEEDLLFVIDREDE